MDLDRTCIFVVAVLERRSAAVCFWITSKHQSGGVQTGTQWLSAPGAYFVTGHKYWLGFPCIGRAIFFFRYMKQQLNNFQSSARFTSSLESTDGGCNYPKTYLKKWKNRAWSKFSFLCVWAGLRTHLCGSRLCTAFSSLHIKIRKGERQRVNGNEHE